MIFVCDIEDKECVFNNLVVDNSVRVKYRSFKAIMDSVSLILKPYMKDIDLDSLVLQKEEVSEARWFTKSELNALRDELKVIPHIEEFDLISNILGD